MTRIGLGNIELTGVDVTIRSNDTSLPVMLYRPDGDVPSRAMILCPGGLGTGDYEILEWLAAALRAIGVVALTMNWRASSPGHDPEDVSIAVDWLASQAFVDPARIGVMGMSRGGNAALRAAAFDRRIKICVTFGPATDFLQQAAGAAIYAPTRHRMLVSWLGDPVENEDFWRRVQAITHAAEIKQPLLMIHGQHDMHSVPEQTLWMKEAVETGGNHDIQLELVPMMGHYGDVVPNGYDFDKLRALILPFVTARL